MPDIKNLAYAILVTSIFLSFPASAGEDQIMLEEVDTNKDSAVSTDEAKAYLEKLNAEYTLELQRQRLEQEKRENERRQNEQTATAKARALTFHPADVNRDGVISPEEHAAYLKKTKPEPVLEVTENKNSLVKEDADEKVPEYIQKKYDRRMEEISTFDTNKDGVLQVEELRKSADNKFNSADTNKDGILSLDETDAVVKKFNGEKRVIGPEANRMKNRFNNADANEDGQVSKEEYGMYMANHQRNFDRNGDGIISKEEYRRDSEKLPSSYRKPPKKED